MKRFGRKGLILVLVGGVAALAVAAVAMASTSKKSASIQVCVLLPDTKSSVRWVQFDAPAMKAAFAKAGAKDRLVVRINEGVAHKVTDDDRKAALEFCVKWLQK